jgi:hypothetical protein
VDDIKMDLEGDKMGWYNWIGLAQDRDQKWAHLNRVINLGVP